VVNFTPDKSWRIKKRGRWLWEKPGRTPQISA
jgi:hypothetical protein